MNNIVDYKIIEYSNSELLEAGVMELIKAGYQPYGSPCCSESEEDIRFIQAMVKYEK